MPDLFKSQSIPPGIALEANDERKCRDHAIDLSLLSEAKACVEARLAMRINQL
jgi:hypothetical protein